MITQIKKYLLIIFLYINTDISIGQIPSYHLFADNFIPNGDYYTANEFTFDINIRRVDTTRFEYAGGQYCINFNTEVANGGTLSFMFASDTSDLPSNLRPENPHIVFGSNISKLVLDINTFPFPGNGFLIPENWTITVAKLKLRTTAVTFSMVGGAISGWWYINLEPAWNDSLTKVYAYIGSAPVEIVPFHQYIRDIGLLVNPVELSGFTSVVLENTVTLNWTTVNEINNSGFDIERKIMNGSWVRIGFVKGNGTTSELKNYSFTDKVNSGKYFYRLKQEDYNGNFEYFELANEVKVGVPKDFELSQNFPNPFNPSTRIHYSIPHDAFVIMKVFDINGREISTLINGIQNAGYHMINFDATHFSAGIYFYSLNTKGFSIAKRMALVK